MITDIAHATDNICTLRDAIHQYSWLLYDPTSTKFDIKVSREWRVVLCRQIERLLPFVKFKKTFWDGLIAFTDSQQVNQLLHRISRENDCNIDNVLHLFFKELLLVCQELQRNPDVFVKASRSFFYCWTNKPMEEAYIKVINVQIAKLLYVVKGTKIYVLGVSPA